MIRKRLLRAMPALFLWFVLQDASACGGDGCDESECLSVVSTSMDGNFCGGDRGFIDMHNDSRSNLALLYAAATGQAGALRQDQDYAQRERNLVALRTAYAARLVKLAPQEKPKDMSLWDADSCGSNFYPAAGAYLDALADSNLGAAPRQQLAALRNRLLCSNAGNGEAGDVDALLREMDGVQGGEFTLYLRASLLFYAARHDEALRTLAGLEQAQNAWIREAAMLLRARSHMVHAQSAWDGDKQNLAAIDRAGIGRSRAALEQYLATYPAGLYRRSAAGLLRRAQYLSGDGPAYEASFVKAWQSAVQERRPLADAYLLIDEAELATPYIDIRQEGDRLVGGLPEDALLHAAGVLKFLREQASEDSGRTVRKYLESHAGTYAPVTGLQSLLLAADAAAHDDWDAANIAATRARLKAPAVIDLSAALIQARALEKRQRWTEALDTWRQIYSRDPGDATAIAAGFTLTALLARQPERLLDPGSPSMESRIAGYAIQRFLSEEQLLAALARPGVPAELHRTLAHTLMMRRLLREDWKGFLQVFEPLAPAERLGFASVETAARTLAAQPEDPKGLLNMGFFLKEYSGNVDWLQHCPEGLSIDATLAPTLPPGFLPRGDSRQTRAASYFRRAIAQRPGGELEAKLLYHGVYCYSQAWGYSCADSSVPPEMRRQWFQELKKRYPESPWAKKLKYWW